nr:RHS repeat-associated core domain-containing protein [Apibacter adventoris]
MQYYNHADHLGSSSYITNLDAQIVQQVEYVPFGEVLIEERNQSWNTPYLFNGKELDEETGLYYYGARYYNPRESVWLSTDPLSGYNPILEDEHYIDGEHNGGVYNSFNLNTYGYTYQNPIRYIDPNGKQADVIYGITSTDPKKDDKALINGGKALSNKSNILTIVSHAGTHGARVVENNKKGDIINGPDSFNQFLTRDSEKWRNREKIGNLVVVMYGCNLARDRMDNNGNSLKTRLQIISSGHPDQVFIGSTTSVEWTSFLGIYSDVQPIDSGKWRVYKAGKLIDEYDGSWNPNTYKEKWFNSNIKEIKSTDTTSASVNEIIPEGCSSGNCKK